MYGRFSIKEYSPHPTTITKNLDEISTEFKSKLLEETSTINSFAIILDHWSNRFNQIKFIGICLR